MSGLPEMRTTDDDLGWSFDDDPAPKHIQLFGGRSPEARPTRDYRAHASRDREKIEAMTPFQRKQFTRNLTIWFMSRDLKITQRDIASVFKLPHSRIAAILKSMGEAS